MQQRSGKLRLYVSGSLPAGVDARQTAALSRAAPFRGTVMSQWAGSRKNRLDAVSSHQIAEVEDYLLKVHHHCVVQTHASRNPAGSQRPVRHVLTFRRSIDQQLECVLSDRPIAPSRVAGRGPSPLEGPQTVPLPPPPIVRPPPTVPLPPTGPPPPTAPHFAVGGDSADVFLAGVLVSAGDLGSAGSVSSAAFGASAVVAGLGVVWGICRSKCWGGCQRQGHSLRRPIGA